MQIADHKRRARRELTLLAALLLVGVTLMPIAIYLVGQSVFGNYEGGGLGDFLATLFGKIAAGDWVAWFLVLSPYLGVQVVRLVVAGWRGSAAADA